ncbi:MAG: circadian clock KaiB family protein [Microcoleaceae cyanobacterium]
MNRSQTTFPNLFKGIALFTPGGDLIYCIDPSKHRRWHLHLCVALQEILSLPEPPHFLVPCYTATLDQWLDSTTQTVQQSAEAYPPVLRYQSLLNAIFGTNDLVWQPTTQPEAVCNPVVLATYYQQFPQLWENHDLIVQLDKDEHVQKNSSSLNTQPPASVKVSTQHPQSQGYVLRLYVSGHSLATLRTLEKLHQLLERSSHYPYTLKVIDVLKHPEQAEADQISATPTLIRIWPLPVRRLVGELDDVSTILQLLSSIDIPSD